MRGLIFGIGCVCRVRTGGVGWLGELGELGWWNQG